MSSNSTAYVFEEESESIAKKRGPAVSYGVPAFIYEYEAGADVPDRRPFVKVEEIDEERFLRRFTHVSSEERRKNLLQVFKIIVRAQKHLGYQQHVKEAVEVEKLKRADFDDLLHALFEMKLIHTKITQSKGKKSGLIHAFAFLKEEQRVLQQEKAAGKSKGEKYTQFRAPDVFKNEKYVAPEVEGINQSQFRQSIDCRTSLSQDSLRQIYSGTDEIAARETFDLFNIVALNVDRNNGKIVKSGTSSKSYAEIVHKAQKFGISRENTEKRLLELCEAGVINTKQDKVLFFFGTPFLRNARSKIDETKREKEEEEETEKRVRTPEFMKDAKYRAPELPGGYGRRPTKIDKDICKTLHKDSLNQIHAEIHSDEGQFYATVYNVVVFDCFKTDVGEIVNPVQTASTNMSFGHIVKRCKTFYDVDADIIASCLKQMMDRKVLFVRYERQSYYVMATPFLRTARLVDDHPADECNSLRQSNLLDEAQKKRKSVSCSAQKDEQDAELHLTKKHKV